LAHCYFAEIQKPIFTPLVGLLSALEDYTTSAAIQTVFASNKIECAGLPQGITTRICQEVWEGTVNPSGIKLWSEEYERALEGLIKRKDEADNISLSRSCKEVVQHALAMKHIITRMCLNETLSEDLIKSTHRILTEGIDGPDGDEFATYSELYRTVAVTAAFNHFTPPE
jgi:hypothetical protein